MAMLERILSLGYTFRYIQQHKELAKGYYIFHFGSLIPVIEFYKNILKIE